MGSSKIREKHGKGGQERGAKEILVPGLQEIANIDANSTDIFSEVLEATSLDSQVQCIRSLLKTVTPEKYKIVSVVIVKWYFNCSGGLKKVISNSLNTVKEPELERLISEEIALHVKTVTRETRSQTSAQTVLQLLAGFDNFPLLERVVLEERTAVVRFVTSVLEELVERLTGEKVSPVVKAELSVEAGSSVRLLVQVVRSSPAMSEVLRSVSSLVYRMVCHRERQFQH